MDNPKKVRPERVVFEGRLYEFVEHDVLIGSEIRTFEIVRRGPGTRLIVVDGDDILMIDEYRYELGAHDLRLPGGKAFDSLDDYRRSRDSGEDLAQIALGAARRELLEETGYAVDDLEYVDVSRSGSTIEWDLYYFSGSCDRRDQLPQRLDRGENIVVQWHPIGEVLAKCLDGTISEDRSVGQLLRFFSDKIHIYQQ